MGDNHTQGQALQPTNVNIVPQEATGYQEDQTVVVQGKGSDTQSPNEAEDEAEADPEAEQEAEGSETQEIPTDPAEDLSEVRLKEISSQQHILANQYAYLARCLTRALDARLAQTLGLMDEAAQTRQEAPALAKIYASHLERLQDKYRAPATVEAELQYEMHRIRTTTRSNGSVAWADFTKKRNDLQMKMCKKVSAEMVALFREKRVSSTGELRVLDWISNNLDVVHDLGGSPKITHLTEAEVNVDLQRLKDKPSTVKEEVNLDQFDVEESNDFLHQLADLAHQQAPEMVLASGPHQVKVEPHQPQEQEQMPSPQQQQQQHAHHQINHQQFAHQAQQPQHQSIQSHQSPQQNQSLPQQPPAQLPTQQTHQAPQHQAPPAPQQVLQAPQALQVPIESHTTTRSRSRSNSKVTRHHSISPAPKRHRHTSSSYQMHPQSPYQVQLQPQMSQQQQQQHVAQQVSMAQQLPPQQQQQQHFAIMSPQQSHMALQQQQMKMYYDNQHQQHQQQHQQQQHQQQQQQQHQQQQQRPQHLQHQPMFLPQPQPVFMPGYEQHPQFPPPPQWGGQPKSGFAQSPPNFPQPMPGIMPGNYYYTDQQHPQHPHPPPPHLHQQYYPGYEQR